MVSVYEIIDGYYEYGALMEVILEGKPKYWVRSVSQHYSLSIKKLYSYKAFHRTEHMVPL